MTDVDESDARAADSNQEQRTRPTAGEIEERSSDTLQVDGRRIRGIVPYNTQSRDMGGWREQISPTAFRNTRLDELRAVIDHKGVPIGRYPNTLDVEDTPEGLRWSLDPPKSRQDVVEAVQRGDMRAGSWRMVVSRDSWQDDLRTVEEISDLLDVTITGAELPAYPAAAVEYRSTDPAEPAKEAVMADQAENQDTTETTEQPAEDRSEPGQGLQVESRAEVVPSRRNFFQEIAVAAREVSVGEARSLTTAVSLVTPEYSTQFFDVLRPQSAFLRSGVRVLSTQSNSIIYPELTSDPTIGWVTEGGTIVASDPVLAAGTATPHKLAVRVEYSNELAEDSAPGVEQILRQALVARAGVTIDVAAFEGSGVSPVPRGMGNTAGAATISAAAANSSIGFAGTAVATLEAGFAPRPYAYVGGTSLIKDLRQVRLGTTYDAPLVSPTGSEDPPPLYGATGYLAPAINSGTCYFYSPSSCYMVNRLQNFEIEVNRFRLFDSDRSEMRLRMRLDYFYPYPAAIVRGTGVP